MTSALVLGGISVNMVYVWGRGFTRNSIISQLCEMHQTNVDCYQAVNLYVMKKLCVSKWND